MANNTPFSGLSDAAGGILLPEAQGALLTNGVLQEAGALALAGDARTTSSRREAFAIWNGTPTAEVVGEGGTKPVTGGEFGGGTLNIKKIASIVTFTDEMLEDVQNGDLNVLVDSGVRTAIADLADANAIGLDSGSAISGTFDSELVGTTQTVEWDADAQDGLATAVSAAMGSLEANGYRDNLGILVHPSVIRTLRDARQTSGGTASATAQAQSLYAGNDPFYGLPVYYSSNLNTLAESAGSDKVVAVVAHRPNIHVRVRHDVRVAVSNDASVGGTSLWQNDLTGIRYVWRGGMYVHDLARSVVKIENAS
ncbi:MAG: phage major capsid protein [Solirubrobacterales bacterium]|nr:phage major capsid protein [Solirubrobacterales bacterium]